MRAAINPRLGDTPFRIFLMSAYDVLRVWFSFDTRYPMTADTDLDRPALQCTKTIEFGEEEIASSICVVLVMRMGW